MSLKKKTISGLFWTFSQQFSVQLISFIVQIILARILLPAEFGLIGMLTIFIAIGNTLLDGGLTSSLIRTLDPGQKDYSTVFFVNLIFSVIIYFLLFFAAPFISSFFNQPILTSVIRLYTLSFIIQAFVAVQTTRLTKAMNFKLQMAMQIPSVMIGGITGILLAYKGYGVWSLVWMNLVQNFLFMIQHWFRAKWFPDFIIDLSILKYHFKFGYKLVLSGLLDTIYQNIYNVIIGKYFSVVQLGYYTRAYSMQQLPVANISTALNKVTYPVFSSMQEDDVKLKSAYRTLMQQVVFWVAPILICLAAVAVPLFRLLLTEKWLPAVPFFRILCAAGIMYPLNAYNLNMLNVKGRSDLFFKLEIAKKILITIGIFCALPFGIDGLLYLQVVFNIAAFFINSFYSGKLISYPVTEQIADIYPLIVIAVISGIFAYWMDISFVDAFAGTDLSRILITGFFYFLMYLGLSYAIRIPALFIFRQLILKK